jgi:transcriptional regulator with XRE-family HTH domain
MGKKEQIGIRIRTMRKSRQMTQEDLAKAIGQSPSSITMYETGRRSPDYETLEALADVFNVPMSALVSNEDPPDEPEPIKDDIRLLIRGLNKLSPEQIAQAKNVFLAMFKATNPDLFDEGDDDK